MPTDYSRDKRTTLNKIAAILDAKREQFFVAVYRHEKHGVTKITEDCLMNAPEFVRRFGDEPIWLLGEGLVHYAHLFSGKNSTIIDKDYWPAKAEKVHQLGWQMACQNRFADPLTLVPFYLRGHEAVPKAGR